MRANTTIHGGGEVAGTKLFTWAIIVVAAGLLVAMTNDFTAKQAPQAGTSSATTAAVSADPHAAS